MKRQIVVGTRGSTVALAEARSVVARLKEEWPETDFRLSTITAKGGGLAGSDDLERALTEERINIAVHALEEFPVVQAEGLELASIPRRLEARVALVGRAGCKSLATLPDGSTIGLTGALRLALVKNFRPDLIVRILEGDLDDRLEALVSGCDAVLMSGSDLLRAELRNRIDELIAPDVILPAPGQGAIALEVRSEDSLGLECAYSIHHRVSDDRVTAERAFLEGLGGNLRAPIGALAVIGEDGTLTLEGCVAAPDGSQVIRASIEGDPDEAEDLGFELADDVLKQGGEALLKLTAA
jgi:hydroxymethylbilane synthase